jgi:hypothetical protein
LKCIQKISNKIFSVLYNFLSHKLSGYLTHPFPPLGRSGSPSGSLKRGGWDLVKLRKSLGLDHRVLAVLG